MRHIIHVALKPRVKRTIDRSLHGGSACFVLDVAERKDANKCDAVIHLLVLDASMNLTNEKQLMGHNVAVKRARASRANARSLALRQRITAPSFNDRVGHRLELLLRSDYLHDWSNMLQVTCLVLK